MKKTLGHTAVFVILYVVFMIPTYLLPYVGSNSSMVNAAGVSSGAGMNPAFWLHLICLMVLVLLAGFRGANTDRMWLVSFPFVALVFDLMPGLNNVPLVPTVMHLVTIIVGVMNGAGVAAASTQKTG